MIMLPPTPTQHYLVSIRLQRKISFVTSFTISKWLKKYYSTETCFWLLKSSEHNCRIRQFKQRVPEFKRFFASYISWSPNFIYYFSKVKYLLSLIFCSFSTSLNQVLSLFTQSISLTHSFLLSLYKIIWLINIS